MGRRELVNPVALGMQWGRVLGALDAAIKAFDACDPTVMPGFLRADLSIAVEGMRGISQRAWLAYSREANPRRPPAKRRAG